MLEGRDIDVSTKLSRQLVPGATKTTHRVAGRTHVLLHILLSMLKGRLSKLRRHLRCRVVHEVAILAKDVAAGASLLLIWVPSRVSSVALL
jgi:hypothetical protein